MKRRKSSKSIVSEWVELADGCLIDKPPRSSTYKYYLFINHCRVRKLPSGRLVLERRTDCKMFGDFTESGVEKQVQEFVDRSDVRLLTKDLESNDFERLPKRQIDVPREIVTGEAEIYQQM